MGQLVQIISVHRNIIIAKTLCKTYLTGSQHLLLLIVKLAYCKNLTLLKIIY